PFHGGEGGREDVVVELRDVRGRSGRGRRRADLDLDVGQRFAQALDHLARVGGREVLAVAIDGRVPQIVHPRLVGRRAAVVRGLRVRPYVGAAVVPGAAAGHARDQLVEVAAYRGRGVVVR